MGTVDVVGHDSTPTTAANLTPTARACFQPLLTPGPSLRYEYDEQRPPAKRAKLDTCDSNDSSVAFQCSGVLSGQATSLQQWTTQWHSEALAQPSITSTESCSVDSSTHPCQSNTHHRVNGHDLLQAARDDANDSQCEHDSRQVGCSRSQTLQPPSQETSVSARTIAGTGTKVDLVEREDVVGYDICYGMVS